MQGSGHKTLEPTNQTSPKYVPVREAVQKVGKSRATFDKYVRMLNIPLVRFHIGTRGYHIAQEDIERIKQLIADPGRLPELSYPPKEKPKAEATTEQRPLQITSG